MSISTKTGDKGQTSLWSGERVDKDDLRVEAYGTIDELNSHLAEAKHYVVSKKIFNIIEEIQNDLFKVAGELASKEKLYVKPIENKDAEKLTEYVHYFENILNLKGFVLPGSTISSAKIDVCRTISRRAERRAISLSKRDSVNSFLMQYINRLSDLLFVMARFEEHLQGKLQYKKW
jgi:ATP:cob(I)alamin adenosyltransferase